MLPALILALVFGAVLLIYSRPMEDVTLDLSLIAKDSHIALETTDEKGWTVYTQTGDTVRALEPTGSGSYRGIELGETFYFSRVMAESLDSPTLQIGTGERMFSVWLDDELIYTDCPDLDNRIGYLTLPMNTTYRAEPIIISLPMHYAGKTLTIAQSTPPYSEVPSVKAYPASVKLYCGYAYESGLIAESFSAAVSMTALFVVGLVLLLTFIRSQDVGMLCIALSAFLWMCVLLEDTSFYTKYFGVSHISIERYARLISAIALMVFLTLRAGRLKSVMWGIVGLQGTSVLFSLLFHEQGELSLNRWIRFLIFHLMEWGALVGFIAILVLGILFWCKEKPFYRLFAPLALGVIAVGWAVNLASSAEIRTTIPVALASGQVTLLYTQTFTMLILTALACAIFEAIRQELDRRTEQQLLESRRELTLASYENMRRQHEEVMMLRHDMNRHFNLLRNMTGEDAIKDYLQDLIGQNENIRPVVQSGNKVLDIILDGTLSAASDTGVRIEITRSEVPGTLPLSDADLCSLVMNIIDNAVTAAGKATSHDPFIRLDLHVKNDFFVLVCENSADHSVLPPEAERKEPVLHKHGLGLKIIRQVAERYHGLVDTERQAEQYKIIVALPLDQSAT